MAETFVPRIAYLRRLAADIPVAAERVQVCAEGCARAARRLDLAMKRLAELQAEYQANLEEHNDD